MKFPLVATFAFFCLGCATTKRGDASNLVFVGTVTKIQSGVTNEPQKSFVVTATVDKIIHGQFVGSRFQFAVHSPALSGLHVGKQYTIRATRTANGYIVDDLRWRRLTTR